MFSLALGRCFETFYKNFTTYYIFPHVAFYVFYVIGKVQISTNQLVNVE